MPYKKLLTPLSISLLYFVAGALWILFSDQWVAGLTEDAETLSSIQTWKGWFYIAVTAVILYILISKHRLMLVEKLELQRKTERKFEDIFINNPFPTIICSRNTGEIHRYNKSMISSFGYVARELKQLTIFDFFDKEQLQNLKHELIAVTSGKNLGIFKSRKNNGSLLYVDISAFELDFEGDPSWMLILKDVTAEFQNRKQIQELTQSLERKVDERTRELNNTNDELEAFTYAVSHDLRAPLRAIDGFSHAVIDEYGDQIDETAREYLERVRKASQKMSDLIDDLLRLSRISRTSLRPETFNLSELVKQIASEVTASQQGLSVEFRFAEDIQITSDKGLVRILFENLISNAVKYSSNSEVPKVEFGSIEMSNNSCFYVRDNGTGFDIRYKDKVFQPFQRLHRETDYPGVGVGLATVYRIVKKLGGEIDVNSEVGAGSTFIVYLPDIEIS